MSTATGEAVWSASYDPYRLDDVASTDAHAANPLRFPGQYADGGKTGVLTYNYHRYYDPGTGRYTQVDPLLSRSPWGNGRGSTLHAYSYAANQPTTLTDPLGLRIETGSQSAWGAIQTMRLDPNLGVALDQIERDPRTVVVAEVPPQDVAARGGAFLEGEFGHAPTVWYNLCQTQMTYEALLGWSDVPLAAVLAHELGELFHVREWERKRSCDPHQPDWAMAFENAVQHLLQTPVRGAHSGPPIGVLLCRF